MSVSEADQHLVIQLKKDLVENKEDKHSPMTYDSAVHFAAAVAAELTTVAVVYAVLSSVFQSELPSHLKLWECNAPPASHCP